MRPFAKASSAESTFGVGKVAGLIVVVTMLATLAFAAGPASAALPTVTPPTVSEVSFASAHVAGTVDPADQETYYSFEYSKDGGVTWSGFTFQGPLAANSGPQAVSTELTGLTAGTGYQVRLVALAFAEFAEVFSAGPDPTFTTPALTAAPTVHLDPVVTVGGTTAHLSGTVDADAPAGPLTPAEEAAYQVNWHFECTPECPGLSGGSVGAGEGSQAVSVEATGLMPSTTYEVKLVGKNADAPVSDGPETFTTQAVPPPTATIESPSGVTGSSAHLSAEINPGGTDPGFEVNYHFECTPECSGVTPGTVPAGTSSVQVSDDTTGLLPNTSYEVSLVASNAGGTTTFGPLPFHTAAIAPAIVETSASPSITEALLESRVNPGGLETTYLFEYGPTEAYGQSTPHQTIAAGGVPVEATAHAVGLSAATSYHFRIVVQNSLETVDGPDHVFTTQARPGSSPGGCENESVRIQQEATALPHCRAYELVSTLPTLGDVARVPGVADSGDQLAYSSILGAEGAASSATASTTVATRGITGWTQTDADAKIPALAEQTGSEALVPVQFSDGFGHALLVGLYGWDSEDQNRAQDLYELGVGTGKVSWLSHGSSLPETQSSFPQVAGAASDLSWVVFTTLSRGLEPRDPAGSIYRRGATGLELVSVLPDGLPATGVAVAIKNSERGPASWAFTQGATVPHGGAHAISADGQKVFFNSNGALFLRAGDHTVVLTESRRAADPPETDLPGLFLGASPDGDVSYFSSPGPLTESATADGGIYRYEMATNTLTQVTAGGQISEALISNDGSHLYFTATAALTSGAVEGATNAYVLSGENLKLIAALEPGGSVRRVSLDGRYAVLQSSMSLAGARSNGHTELYEYDDQTGDLACASCRAGGGASQGDANLDQQVPGLLLPSFTQPRNLADDGRLFFASTDRLVAADGSSAADIYEYDRGTISLLSSGKGDNDAYMIDNSDNGKNVFFTTRAALTRDDKDPGYLDVYDARENGGFLFPEAGKPPCRDEECQGEGAPPPASILPGSVGLTAARQKTRSKHRLKVSNLSPAQRSTLARTGAVTLGVRLTGPGKLTVTGRGKIAGKPATLGNGSRKVATEAPTTVQVKFSLSTAARRQLAERGRLQVLLETHLSGSPATARNAVNLTRAHR